MINDLNPVRGDECEGDGDRIRFDFTVRGDDLSFLNRDWPIQYLKIYRSLWCMRGRSVFLL